MNNQQNKDQYAEEWVLLEKYAGEKAPEWKASLLEHCRIVYDICMLFAKEAKVQIDTDTLAKASILHDIGRTEMKRVEEHGILSGLILRQHGYPESVIEACETHLGVGIDADEAERLGLGRRDLNPRTVEAKILSFCDNLVSYDRESGKFSVGTKEDAVERFAGELGQRYGEKTRRFMDSVEALLGEDGKESFSKQVAEYNRKLRAG